MTIFELPHFVLKQSVFYYKNYGVGMDKLENKIINFLNWFEREAKSDENFILNMEKLILLEKILSAKSNIDLVKIKRILLVINKIHYQKYTLHSKLNQLSKLSDYWH